MSGERVISSRVLVIDDSADLRELLCDFLSALGHDPAAAANGEDGLRLLRASPRPTLVLLDRNIPLLDGPAFLELAGGDLEGIPVIWMTGSADDVPHRSIVATLRKPFDLEALERVLRAHLPPD
jgi:CheY-like chemotaxis protein